MICGHCGRKGFFKKERKTSKANAVQAEAYTLIATATPGSKGIGQHRDGEMQVRVPGAHHVTYSRARIFDLKSVDDGFLAGHMSFLAGKSENSRFRTLDRIFLGPVGGSYVLTFDNHMSLYRLHHISVTVSKYVLPVLLHSTVEWFSFLASILMVPRHLGYHPHRT